MTPSVTVKRAQVAAGFFLRKYHYPAGATITYSEHPPLGKSIAGLSHPSVAEFASRKFQEYPDNDIYITVPSKITADWRP